MKTKNLYIISSIIFFIAIAAGIYIYWTFFGDHIDATYVPPAPTTDDQGFSTLTFN